MLQVFRQGIGSWFVKGFMALLIFAFVIWGIADVFRNFGTSTLASVGKTPGEKVGERQIIAIVVGGWLKPLSTLKIRHGIGDLFGLDVKLGEVVIGVKVLRLELGGLLELFTGTIDLSQADEVGGEIGPGGGGIRVQPDGFLKVGVGRGVLRLCRVNHAKKFVNFKAFRDLLEQVLQLCGGFGVVCRVILSDGRLEFVIETRVLDGVRWHC